MSAQAFRSIRKELQKHDLSIETIDSILDDFRNRIEALELKASEPVWPGQLRSKEGTTVNNPVKREDIELAERLLSWAQQREYTCMSQIYNKGPNPIREKKVAKRIVQILVEHGWFIPVEGGMEIDGSHRREAWRVVREVS